MPFARNGDSAVTISNGLARNEIFSIVIPVFNNEGSLGELLTQLTALRGRLSSEIELVFVDDGSVDSSATILADLLRTWPGPASLIRHSRNFGSFSAIRSGLLHATGAHAAVMAADLQEPVSLIEDFHHVLVDERRPLAVGVRHSRNDPASSAFSSRLFWRMYRRFVQPDMPVGGVDVFGCSRDVVDQLLALRELNTSLVGQLIWLGFPRREIPYDRQARHSGVSGWTLRKKFRYMADSIFSFTDLPIRLVVATGLFGVVMSLAVGVAVLVARFTTDLQTPGYTPIVLTITFTGALILLALGVTGSYVWRTYENTKGRPRSVIRDVQRFGHGGAR
jgi:glycosyltransferase involved in cell wall biosynthesis